jgi:hypothetical protein
VYESKRPGRLVYLCTPLREAEAEEKSVSFHPLASQLGQIL